MNETLRIDDVARMYHRHPNEIRLLARLGRIPAFKVGYSWRFRAEELSVWEKRGGNLNEG